MSPTLASGGDAGACFSDGRSHPHCRNSGGRAMIALGLWEPAKAEPYIYREQRKCPECRAYSDSVLWDKYLIKQCLIHGGEGGIRTHGTPKGTTVFETAPFDHSGTSPRGLRRLVNAKAARNLAGGQTKVNAVDLTRSIAIVRRPLAGRARRSLYSITTGQCENIRPVRKQDPGKQDQCSQSSKQAASSTKWLPATSSRWKSSRGTPVIRSHSVMC